MSHKLFDLSLKAIEFIEDHLSEPISIKEVTLNFEKSHWQFQRLFRSVVGLTLGQYLRERRLAEAALKLRAVPAARVLDIAIEFEFGSQEAFARSFKGCYGVSPTAYRENKNIALREARSKITPDKLQYFWNNIQREPDLIELKEKHLVGIPIEFKSHFVEGSDCSTKVVAHWQSFKKQRDSIPHQLSNELLGVVLSTELDLREQKLTYFSSVEVRQALDFPKHMQSMVLPAGLYACFENRGCADQNRTLMDYMYGIWLPSSYYDRGLGFDVEIFDHRYSQGNPNSISRFLIPVKKR